MLEEICLESHSLSQLFRYSPVRPQDQFLRLREQLKCQPVMGTPQLLQQGCDIVHASEAGSASLACGTLEPRHVSRRHRSRRS